MDNLKNIIALFNIQGDVVKISPLGNGLINTTYKVETASPSTPDYVLQKINTAVFKDVDLLQANIEAVTKHIRGKLKEANAVDINRKVLTFIDTFEGKTYTCDSEGCYWRMMIFIPEAYTYETVNEKYSRLAGREFGHFEAMLADIPYTLGETIPDFHNMEFRLKQLREAVATDAAGRVAEMKFYINEMERRSEEMCQAERLFREGKLPKRICHCDTKVNNMLFDKDGNVLCVIDLDTVMPGFIFSDYGDFLRTAANTTAEDDANLDNVGFNMGIFKAFTEGYLEGARPFLTPIEISMLPYATALFPYMQCVRFLTDYINGDTYYRIKYPEHNLVRTKNQFKLLECVEAATPEMQHFIELCVRQ